MENADTDQELHAHLIDLGLTKRAAVAIGADLHDLAEGIAEIEAKMMEMNTLSPEAVQDVRFEIELHLRPHLTSPNAELRSLQRRKPSRGGA